MSNIIQIRPTGIAHFIGADFVVNNDALNVLNNQLKITDRLNAKFPNYLEQYQTKKPIADCLDTDTRVFSLVLTDSLEKQVTYTPLAVALQQLRDKCQFSRVEKLDIYIDGLNIHEGNMSCTIKPKLTGSTYFGSDEVKLNVPYSVKNAVEYAFADSDIDVHIIKQNKVIA